MAQQDFNVSFPNDGLGDELRAAFVKQQNMNTELYDTKVDKVTGKGLSANDYTDADKLKVDNIVTDAEKNVQSDWNETDPTSDAYIKGKPVFESSEIIVSALWTGTGFVFDVIADAFPVSGSIYSASPAEITLTDADASLDRIDLIVAQKPQGTAQLGLIGKIEGVPASAALVIPPDYDPSEYYVIKQITVKAAATEPDGAENIIVFEDGTEWTPTLTANVAITTNDPSTGTHSAEATNSNFLDYVNFQNNAELSTEVLDLLTFDFKLKNPSDAVGKVFYVSIYKDLQFIKTITILDGQNGFNSQSSSYQTISLLKSDLNLNIEDFDKIWFRPNFNSAGWFIDNIQIRKGSGSETDPTTGIPEAPADGNLYGRKNQAWEQFTPSGASEASNVSVTPAVGGGSNVQQVLEAHESGKQATLVSGTNIKTVNNQPLLGSGNIQIGDGALYTLDKDILNKSNLIDNEILYETWGERLNIAVGGETIDGVVINTYRIPSCIFAPNGDVLIFAEARLSGSSDDADAGIFYARMRDSNVLEKTLLFNNEAGINKSANPNTVLDGNRIYLFYTQFDEGGTPNLTNDIKTMYVYSDDNGVTWSAQIEYLANDQNSGSAFKWINSPASSILHSGGNIIIPIWGKYVAGTSPTYFRSGIVVWDGTTFTKRILEAVDSINEPTVYEDENGDIVMSCRTGSSGANNRVTYRTDDFGVTWTVDASTGNSSFSVYVNIKKFNNELYKLEIEDGALSSQRKNLNLYKGSLSNLGYNKILDISEREDIIWGYGCMDNYLDRFVAVSEDKPDINIYNVRIENRGITNVYRNNPLTPDFPDVDFYAELIANGNDDIVPLIPTNGGNVTFSGAAIFDRTDNSYLEYADNGVFDMGGSPTGQPFYMSFNLWIDDDGGTQLFMNKNGDSGTSRTWDIRISGSKLSFLVYSELTATTPNISYTHAPDISINTWYHIIVTEDGTGNPKIYVNNVLDGSAVPSSGTFISMGNSSNNVVLGRHKSSSALNFEGKINKWSIGKVIPSAAQRVNLYNRDKMT